MKYGINWLSHGTSYHIFTIDCLWLNEVWVSFILKILGISWEFSQTENFKKIKTKKEVKRNDKKQTKK